MTNHRYTLKIHPEGWGRIAYRIIEICGTDTLNQLCSVILDAFDFTDEHLYEFCMDNRMYSDDNYQSDPESGERSANIKLDRLRLSKGQKFSLHYDFGDDWMFRISVTKIETIAEYQKPVVVKAKGEVEQYPGCEWDWEDEEYEE